MAKIRISLLFGCPQRIEMVLSKSGNGEIRNLPSSFLAIEGVEAKTDCSGWFFNFFLARSRYCSGIISNALSGDSFG